MVGSVDNDGACVLSAGRGFVRFVVKFDKNVKRLEELELLLLLLFVEIKGLDEAFSVASVSINCTFVLCFTAAFSPINSAEFS